MRLPSRRDVGAVAVDSLFRGAAGLGALHPRARPERHGVETIRDLPYQPGGNPAHTLDVYRPSTGSGPRPVVLYVHGGGFRILSKDTHWLMGIAYARRGYVVFNVNYRLGDEAPYPAAIADVCAAYAWVRANAAAYGGDPGRIVLAGESAGANLVAALATALCWERPEPFAAHAYSVGAAPSAVVAACGVFQVSDVARLVRRKPNMSSFVQDRLYEVEAAYLRDGTPTGDPTLDLADPLVFVERASAPARTLPPFFLPVGTRDPLLPDTRRFAAALRAHGSATEAAYYRGEPHAFHAFVFLPNARRCWEDTWRFLERHAPTQS